MGKITKKVVASILAVALIFGCVSWQNPTGVRAMDDSTFVKELTLTDTDADTDGTLTKYDLLEDPTKGLTLNEGDTYVFDMDILANRYNANQGGTAKPFGFDLLGNPTKSDNGAEIKLAGIEFCNKNALYWITNGAWNAFIDQSQQFTIWGGGNYHYRFTVKAYESIRVEFCYSAGYLVEKKGFDATVAWNQIYGLSNCKAGDGTLFYPNLAFLDQDGTVSNIQCTYVRETKPPVIGEKDTDLAKDRELPNSFAGNEDLILDLGRVVPTTDGNSWNYSATFRYDQFGGEYSGLNAIFAEGIYGGKRQNLMIAAKAHKQGEQVVDTQLVLSVGTDGTVLHEATLPAVYATGVEYTLTVRESGGKVSFWIDDDLLLEEFDLTAAKVTDLAPKFGFNADGTAGTFSAIHVWGDIDRSTVPEMGEGDTDIAVGKKLPTAFSGHDSVTLDLGKLTSTQEDPTWVFSGKFTYSQLVNGYGGLNITFAEGMHKDKRKDMTVTARAHMVNGQVTDTQIVLWTGVNGDVLYLAGIGDAYRTDREYRFTVQLKNNKVSFWIDHSLLVNEVDLAANGVTGLRPKFGLCGNGTAGTLAELHVWGDLAPVMPATRPETAANLLQNCEEFVSFSPTIGSYYYDNSRIRVQGDTWFYSGKYTYTGMPAYGGITPIFGEGTYTTSAGSNTAAITGTRQLSVTARSGGFEGETRRTQCVIWVDGEPILVGGVAGVSLELGKEYTWTVEMKNGLLTYWLDGTLVFDEVDLASYGVTNIRPKFGLLTDGSSGSLSDVQVWDATTSDPKPTYTSKDVNNAVITDVNVSAATGRLLYEGISYTDDGEYYYSADVKDQTAGENIRLVVAKNGSETIEAYYDGTEAHLVRSSNGRDTEIAKNAVNVDITEKCSYIVKYSAGKISVWVNDVLVLSKVAAEGSVPAAGIGSNKASGTVTNVRLWGDVSQIGGIVYQRFADIASYRGDKKTYPGANGYVFGGWYQDANEENPLAADTKGGSAYAKLVPETVLSVKTQVLKDTAYTSDKTNLRFVTTVDSLQYLQISITLSSQGKTRCFAGRDVYKAITVAKNEAASFTSPKKSFCSDSEYFFTVNVKDINVFDAAWKVVPGWTTFDGTMVTGVETTVAVNDKFNKRITKEELGLNGSTLLQIASANASADIMSYVIRTKDNKVIVIDGGSKNDAEYLVWILKNRYHVSTVDAWYVTHEDDAHYGALESILNAGSIDVNKIYYNFLANSQTEFKALLKGTKGAEEIGRATHTYGEVKIHVINDGKDYTSSYDQNGGNADKACMVLLAEFGGTKNTGVLFLGDVTKDTEACIAKQAELENISLKGKIVQVAKHGSDGCSKAFYEYLKPTACLWPTVLNTWDYNSELRSFLEAKGAAAQYSSVHGNYEFY